MPTAYRTPEQAAAEAASLTPTPRQLAWQEMEFTCFAHLTVNTFTDLEWGNGTEPESVFNPTALDAGQWAAACRDAGMKVMIMTAKHHDGFCLWPSQHTNHSVKNSPWRGGKGDVVREGADACRAAGIKFGVYLSPWDRNSALYGTDAYNDYFKNQLRELLTNYGEIAEVWFDGACGEGPNGKRQQYDWPGYIGTVRELQPNAVVGPCGPDVRWVGNESGFARETEWCVAGVDAVLDPPAFRDWNEVFYLGNLNEPGRESQPGSLERLCQAKHLAYWPSEVDVSIRPGWFYHATEDLRVHSLERMVDMYYRSVGRNCVLLLNVPPDRRGLFHEHDVARLKEMRRTLDATFRTNLALGRPAKASGEAPKHPAKHVTDGKPGTFWQAPAGTTAGEIEIELGGPTTFDRLMLEEMLTVGQRIEEFRLDAWHGEGWKEVCRGTTVGHKRLERFGEVTSDRVRVVIAKARACPTLRAVGLYRAPFGG